MYVWLAALGKRHFDAVRQDFARLNTSSERRKQIDQYNQLTIIRVCLGQGLVCHSVGRV